MFKEKKGIRNALFYRIMSGNTCRRTDKNKKSPFCKHNVIIGLYKNVEATVLGF